mmetsp:Transcript_34515/g.58553  ORF Transcript_34515/g.58553 Transcript_34515/m.58553 type:complete len:95 (-) Transcript_34515:835-1119(-)
MRSNKSCNGSFLYLNTFISLQFHKKLKAALHQMEGSSPNASGCRYPILFLCTFAPNSSCQATVCCIIRLPHIAAVDSSNPYTPPPSYNNYSTAA